MNVQSVDAALLRECIAAAPAGKLDQFLADMAAAGILSLKVSFYMLDFFLFVRFASRFCMLAESLILSACLISPGLSPTREAAGAMVRKLAHTPGIHVALGKLFHISQPRLACLG